MMLNYLLLRIISLVILTVIVAPAEQSAELLSDKTYADQSEQLFLDHFAIPAKDIRRQRKGIYGLWIIGKKPHRVQVIMLDLQRFRDPFQKGIREEQFSEQPGKTLLGLEQWAWLEKQLKTESEVRIIGSGIQVLANDHLWRRWGMFPDDRERLMNIITETKGTIVLLSVDRHRGELSELKLADKKILFDITSSSFNHC